MMKKKRLYMKPEVENFKVQSATLLAGSGEQTTTPQLTNEENEYDF